MYFFTTFHELFTARGDRMKEAKSEAERIVSSYRAEMEVNYQVSLAKVKTQLRTLITKHSIKFSVFKYI